MKKQLPAWVDELLHVFVDSVEWTSVKSDPHQIFTYRCKLEEGMWYITVEPVLHEHWGGRNDGAVVTPRYMMDVMWVAEHFDQVRDIGFDTDRLEVNIEGLIGKNHVYIVFSRQPGSRMKKLINAYSGEIIKRHNNVQQKQRNRRREA